MKKTPQAAICDHVYTRLMNEGESLIRINLPSQVSDKTFKDFRSACVALQNLAKTFEELASCIESESEIEVADPSPCKKRSELV